MGAAALVLPEFALIALGVVLRRWAWRSGDFWSDVERLVYLVLFPVLLVRTTLAADLRAEGALPALAAALAATGAGALLGAAARLVLRVPGGALRSGWQNAFRFNSYLALGVAGTDAGSSDAALALMGVLLGVNVPLVNLLAVTALARGAGGHGRALLVEVARNPLILATVAGLVGNVAGLTLPGPVDATLGRLGSAAVPLGLLSVGAALRPAGIARGTRALAAYLTVVKLVAVPAVALALAAILNLSGGQRGVLLAFAAVPPATSSYILTVRMRGDAPFVAAQTSVATAASVLTLPLWIALPWR